MSNQDVNDLLAFLAESLKAILGDQLFGLYLTGSLTYGGFDRGSSDIDFLAVLHQALSGENLNQVRRVHARIASSYPIWANRIEGSYVTKEMLSNIQPPRTPRPYINEGRFWDPDPVYGNEWLINLYALYKRGVSLTGPDPKTFIGPINISEVREASKRDLLEEWQPKLRDQSFFANSHYQAYAILTMCRILHRARNSGLASKRMAAAWVKRAYGKRWSNLIERAETWQHGRELNAREETIDFIRFTVDQIVAGI
jgi:predicted nucleotidyltransferase